MVRVILENLTKKFGESVAVDNLSLDVKDKEFFVLLGPSGCGKTTTLNMIAGLEEVTSGRIYFDGEIVNDIPPERRDVAMVFQSYALYPHMTNYDNIAFPLRLRKRGNEEIRRRVKDVAGLLRIGHLLHRKPHELSGGERQRVALARAIIREPKVFLMDEPLSNIDAKLRIHMRTELIRLQKDLRTTTIYVTHDQVEAMTMADRVAIMYDGSLMQLGSPLDAFERPRNLFVGGFIGSPPMNLFDGTLFEGEGKSYLRTSHFDVEVPTDLAATVRTQASSPDLVMGVRPQDILVFKAKQGPQSSQSEVYAVEPLGTEVIVDLKVGDQIVKSVAEPSFRAEPGEKVWMSIDAARIHIFDRKTESCLV